jgi:hypothetical protein
MSSTTIFYDYVRLHVSTLLVGHHQALLRYKSENAVYILGSRYVYIDKMFVTITSVYR